VCAHCGLPPDARYFDDSGLAAAPTVGSQVVVARFALPPQYCGVLEYFTQYTDALAVDASQIGTPTLEWLILVNGRPLDPYLRLRRIVNPWGDVGFPIRLRLDDAATVEFVVRGVTPLRAGDEQSASATAPVTRVGGRIVGRYWYDVAYGDVATTR
jgi:hypothetical protein